MYGLSGLYGSNLFSYNSYSTSAYRKLLQSQYGSNRTSRVTRDQQNSRTRGTQTSKNVASPYSDVIKNSQALSSDANKLSAVGKDAAFTKKITVDEYGKRVQSYDKDKIYNAVKGFVNDYNKVIDSALYSGNQSLQASASSMGNTTRIMSRSLNDVGISMGRDGKLSIDEETFKNSNMDKVKQLFNGSGSYAKTVGNAAARIESTANYQSNRASTGCGYYGSNGRYGSSFSDYFNYAQMSMFNSLF